MFDYLIYQMCQNWSKGSTMVFQSFIEIPSHPTDKDKDKDKDKESCTICVADQFRQILQQLVESSRKFQ